MWHVAYLFFSGYNMECPKCKNDMRPVHINLEHCDVCDKTYNTSKGKVELI